MDGRPLQGSEVHVRDATKHVKGIASSSKMERFLWGLGIGRGTRLVRRQSFVQAKSAGAVSTLSTLKRFASRSSNASRKSRWSWFGREAQSNDSPRGERGHSWSPDYPASWDVSSEHGSRNSAWSASRSMRQGQTSVASDTGWIEGVARSRSTTAPYYHYRTTGSGSAKQEHDNNVARQRVATTSRHKRGSEPEDCQNFGLPTRQSSLLLRQNEPGFAASRSRGFTRPQRSGSLGLGIASGVSFDCETAATIDQIQAKRRNQAENVPPNAVASDRLKRPKSIRRILSTMSLTNNRQRSEEPLDEHSRGIFEGSIHF